MRQNKQQDLFKRFKHNQPALAKFLSDHPSLAWVQLMFNGELTKAAEVLFRLAENEKELVARKRVNIVIYNIGMCLQLRFMYIL
jgi:nuclear pore complex protein Nup133